MTLLQFQNNLGKEFSLQPDDFIQVLDNASCAYIYLSGDKAVDRFGRSLHRSIDEIFAAYINEVFFDDVRNKLNIFINL